MVPHLQVCEGINTRLIERVISEISGVISAEVWLQKAKLVARVIVSSDCILNGSDIQFACMRELGPEGTPVMFTLERALLRAA